jgi:hypothetical protein
MAIIGMLASLTVVSTQRARQIARDTGCASNLHAVGRVMHGFLTAHNGKVAPVVRDRDFYWDRGEQRGWDIEIGRWGNAIGGPGSIWRCPVQETAYVGNPMALGQDSRDALPAGRLYAGGPHIWGEPAKLAVAFDVQSNLLDPALVHTLYPALEPQIGDISSEHIYSWPRGEGDDPNHPLLLDEYGPHLNEGYGVLFGDGHAKVGLFRGPQDGMLWRGRIWWIPLEP